MRLARQGRLGRAGGSLVAGALLAFQAVAGTPMSRALDQIRASAMRPVPVVPQRDLPRPDRVWVPHRFVRIPGVPAGVRVPAHWERRISDRKFHVPPLVIFRPTEGTHHVVPAGIRGPARLRHGP